MCSYEPRRLPSLQYTIRVLSGCSRSPTSAILSAIAASTCRAWRSLTQCTTASSAYRSNGRSGTPGPSTCRTRSAGTGSPARARPRTPAGSRGPARCKVPSGMPQRGVRATAAHTTSPTGVGVRLHRLDDQVPRHAVEELLDVQIDHPVVLPTALPACRPPRPRPTVRAGIRRSPDGRSAPPSASRLRATTVWATRSATVGTPSILGPHRHAASGSPPPAPEAESSCPTTSGSRSCTDCSSDPSRTPRSQPVHSRCTLVRPDFLPRLPDFPLRNIKRLA